MILRFRMSLPYCAIALPYVTYLMLMSLCKPALRDRNLMHLFSIHASTTCSCALSLFVDVLIMLWIAGMLFQEAKEAYRQGRERYLSQYWNLVTLFMLGLFVASGVLWLAGYFMAVSGNKTWAIPVNKVFGTSTKEIAYRLILLSNAFFSIGMVLSFFHASNYFQVSSVLGPLQLSLVNMIRDISKFLFLFLLLFLAFGWAERKVYSQYVQARETFVGNTTEHEFAK